MAWTAPRDWTGGEFVTEAMMDTHVRDNLLAVGPHLIARKTADESNNTTTYGADDHLFTTSIPANEVWYLRWVLILATSSQDPKFRLTFPSGSIAAKVNGITGDRNIGGSTSPTTGSSSVWNNESAGFPGIIEAVFTNGATPGSVGLDWALNVASGTLTMKTNSTLWGVKLA